MAEEESTPGRWDSVPPDMLTVGDRVRVALQHDESNQQEAEVVALHCSMDARAVQATGYAVQLRNDDNVRFCAHRNTWNFSRWVPEEQEVRYQWVDVDPSELRPGDVARGLDTGGRFGVRTPEAEVTEETITTQDEYVYLAGSGGWDRARQWQRRVPVLAAPQVGDRFTRAFNYSGWGDRRGCVVRTVRSVGDAPGQTLWAITYDDANGRYWSNDLLVRPDGTCSPSVTPVGETRDCSGRYVPEPGGLHHTQTEVSAPLLTPEVLRRARAVDVEDGPRPLPAWATSLDAARRYVHAQAVDLYNRDLNCWSGTRDFLSAAGLPTDPNRPLPDESEEIRAFLATVREAALSTAEDHGKDSDQVRTWLREHGIVPAPPALVQHTFTVQTPADANVRQVLLDLGWVVQD